MDVNWLVATETDDESSVEIPVSLCESDGDVTTDSEAERLDADWMGDSGFSVLMLEFPFATNATQKLS